MRLAPYKITRAEWESKLTDGHTDCDAVKAGAIMISPVKVKGAGVYAGDAHAPWRETVKSPDIRPTYLPGVP